MDVTISVAQSRSCKRVLSISCRPYGIQSKQRTCQTPRRDGVDGLLPFEPGKAPFHSLNCRFCSSDRGGSLIDGHVGQPTADAPSIRVPTISESSCQWARYFKSGIRVPTLQNGDTLRRSRRAACCCHTILSVAKR